MGTIFVAYGGPEGRERVLEFAARRARASDDGLYVYHIPELAGDATDEVRAEIAAVLDRTAPDVTVEIAVDDRDRASDATNVSPTKRLVDAVLDADREFEYVVMGHVDRGTLERLTVPSMTEAVLETRSIPVVLVPA